MKYLGNHWRALNRLFRKAGVNRYTECRVCNFRTRSIIVVNAKCNNAEGYKIQGVIDDYLERHKGEIAWVVPKQLRVLFAKELKRIEAERPKNRDRLWVLG